MKAILVVDKPESCTSCLLGIYYKRQFCLKTLKDIDITDRYHTPEWCPLKPIPQKKEHQDEIDYEYGYIDGWNECIDAILEPNSAKGEAE